MPSGKDRVSRRTIADLARELKQAREGEEGRGNAVFLVGAGCSVGAGIPLAADVARYCAVQLAFAYSDGKIGRRLGDVREDELVAQSEAAFAWLNENHHLDRLSAERRAKPDWSYLYGEFFGEHLKAPNIQRDIIANLVDRSRDQINWAHACLGELVSQRYVHTVLTTNFDQLVLSGIIRTGIIPVVADGVFAFNRILGRPPFPQVVHLHGSMHTYDLRNSPNALREPGRDPGVISMINTLLRECNVLVVVGYAGGEEGVMKTLRKAAKRHERLVIYWVTYRENEVLSEAGTRLMRGENKFTVFGGEADEFFSKLMSALGIGAPGWIRDPMGDLRSRRNKVAIRGQIRHVESLVDAYQRRIDKAVAFAEEGREIAARQEEEATQKFAAGDYAGAREAFARLMPTEDVKIARQHAFAALRDAQGGAEAAVLRDIANEFKDLVARTEGSAKLENLESVGATLLLLVEAPGLQESEKVRVLEELHGEIDRALHGDGVAEGDKPTMGRLLYYIAQSEHQRADIATEGDENPSVQALDLYRSSIEQYQRCLQTLKEVPGETDLIYEVQGGYAGALQVVARADKDVEKAKLATEIYRNVVSNSWREGGLQQDANLHLNLASALRLQADLVEAEERPALRREGALQAERAANLFQDTGDETRRDEALSLAAGLQSQL